MKIQLSEHFTYSKLLRFVFPSIIMMIFTSIYGVVDGLFVSNYVGKTAFAAINLIMPFLMGVGAIGFMVGTGGSAIVSKTIGEGKTRQAKQYFSMLVIFTFLAGLCITLLGQALLPTIAAALDKTGNMAENCILYGRILLCSLPFFMLQNVFQSFFVTAQKPVLGLMVAIAAGISNMFLDFLLIVVFDFGIAGAAIATAISEFVGGGIPIFYFAAKNSSLLRFARPRWEGRVLLKACTNGSSELMTNLSMSVVNMLYNFQLMRFAGEDGVAAYGTIMYVNFIFISIYLGYSIGCAPIIGYHYGAGNHSELKNMFQKSLTAIVITGLGLTALAWLCSTPLARIFVGYDRELFYMTRHGFQLFVLSYLISGVNIFASAFFTALNNGAVSAAISFLRTLVFQVFVVLVLPFFLKINGIWLAVVFSEALSLAVSICFFVKMKGKYHYI